MKATAKNKPGRMTAMQERKLAEAVPEMFAKAGLSMEVVHGDASWTARSARFPGAVLTVTPHVPNDGHPWLACRFDRDYPRPDLPWDAPENRQHYRDIADALGANPHSGKFNCHVHDRLTAAQALDRFEFHLRSALLAPVAPPGRVVA